MNKLIFKIGLTILFLTHCMGYIQAQNGDQVLDGIGETDMLARYLFNGDLKDWSRNNHHATYSSNEVSFKNDSRFGKVISLSGASHSYITIPKETLTDLESITISGWIFLRSSLPGQHFFDFGSDAGHHFFVAPAGSKTNEGNQAMIAVGQQPYKGAVSPALATNQWVHIAVVVDIPSKLMTGYVDGKPVSTSKDIPQELSSVFGRPQAERSLYIGKAIAPGAPNLNALLHDFRIYRVALKASQVMGIYKHSAQLVNESLVNTRVENDSEFPQFSINTPQLFNSYLVSVPDVNVETIVGNLPRLPGQVQGTYKNAINGPKVRVLWPSDTDNSAVLKPGNYMVTGRVPGTDLQPKAFITVKAAAAAKTPVAQLKMFRLDQVALSVDEGGNETQFTENRDKFINTLAKTDPNSFLYMFRDAFGQQQPAGAKPLGVWDTRDTKLRGHATGHYLTALAQAYAGTGYDQKLQAIFYQKINYMVNALYDLSQLSGKPGKGHIPVSDPTKVQPGPGKPGYDSDLSKEGIRTDYWNWGKGFISAYPPDQFIMLEKGAKYGGQKNQIWAPYYTLHKILAGLIDIYEVNGNKKALETATGMADWVYARLSKLPTDTLIKMWNTYIAGEFGGMNESMAHLYRITGNPNYLKTAKLFDNIRVFFGDKNHTHGLAKNVDIFRGLHANQHIPQIVGSIETYRVSNNPAYYHIADNFWHKVVNDYTYSIGGVAGARHPANAECFPQQPGTLYENGFSEGGQNETCATYNMLKLTGDLFLFDPRVELMDYYERALYNHILASVDKNTPANTYHVSLRPGAVKQFSNAEMTGFTCCNGTALESSTKLQNSIYTRSDDDQTLYVNLYVPSTLDWSQRKIKIIQNTQFPKADHTRLTIRGNGAFDMQLRVPTWATKGFLVTINGKEQTLQAIPGKYLKISRRWKDGDTIEIKMPFQFHLDPVMDQQNIASLFYGPILLAAQEPEPRKEWRKIVLHKEDLGKSVQGNPEQLTFTIGNVTFKPFYETYGRHSVYFNVALE